MTPIDNNTDYYLENDRVVFTAAFHIKRGSCCGNYCRHCPYEPKHTPGSENIHDNHKGRIETGRNHPI